MTDMLTVLLKITSMSRGKRHKNIIR